MINVKQLNFSYNKAHPLFKNMDMQLHSGHIYGLLGKNGAGKSTLLKNMAGLFYPKSGHVKALGHDPTKREPSFLKEISFIPEEFHLPGVKSEQFIRANAVFYPNFDQAYFDKLVQEFDIPIQQRLADMSYGQKKKYIISFGLACQTKLIIMDEPTNGLDIPSKAQFRKVMASALAEDRCIIISTHQVRDLDNLIDAVIILDDHKIVLNTTIEKLTHKISFTKTQTLKPEALYAETNLGGYNSIQLNEGGEDTKVDLELLFNGVLQQKTKITNHLTALHHEQYI